MLPIHKAIAVDQEAIVSGSTKPCVMTLADSQEKIAGDYVVKVFKPNNIEQSQPTNKEVFGFYESLQETLDYYSNQYFRFYDASALQEAHKDVKEPLETAKP